MNRCYVLCNMVQTLDGKAVGNFFFEPQNKKPIMLAFKNHEEYLKNGYNAFALGKNTFDKEFTKGFKPDYSKYKNIEISYEDFISKTDCKKFVVSFDRKGNVGWQSNILKGSKVRAEDSHIIEVLTENAPKENIAYYKNLGISYIFCGKDDIDINLALEKLKKNFGIEKLILSGGPTLNGSFLKAGCIDEIALVICSTTGDTNDKCLFNESVMTKFKITKTQVFNEDNMICVNYVKV